MQLIDSIKRAFTKAPATSTAVLPATEKRAACPPVPVGSLNSLISLLNGSMSGQPITIDTALGITPLVCAIRAISEGLASLPFLVYKQEGKTINPAKGHPLYYLLSKEPSPGRYTTYLFFRTLITNTILYGDGYALIKRDPTTGRPMSFKILNPATVKLWETDQGTLYYLVSGQPGQKRNTPTPYPTSDIIHIPFFSTTGISGVDILKRNGKNLGISLSSQEYAAAFFENGAHVGGVIEHPGVLTPEGIENIRSGFEGKHAGASNTGKTAVLDEGMTFKSLGLSPDKAMLIEVRKFQVEEVSRLLRVPMHMLSALDRATFNSVELIDVGFLKHTLRPWAKLIESEFDRKVFTEEEKHSGAIYTRFNMDGVLRGDTESRAAYYQVMFQTGAFSPNDILALENRNPRPGGDKYYTPLNFQSNDKPTDTNAK